MNRPAGVTVSAVFLILGSLFTLLVGLVVPFAHSLVPPEPPASPPSQVMLIFVSGALVICAIWGLVTAVDLFRMRRWARNSTLVIGALLVVFCGLSLLMILILPQFLAELESTPRAGIVMDIIIAIYLFPIFIGIWWLIYFTRAKVKAEFLRGFVPAEGPRRPLSIAVIAWHAIALGILTIPYAFSSWPAFLFGIVLTGLAAKLTYFFFGAADLAIGTGLLKLKPWGLTLAVWFCIFTIVLSGASALLPDKAARMNEFLRDHPLEFPGNPAVAMEFTYWVIVVSTWLTFGTALWYLLTRKKAYLDAAEVRQAAT